MIISQNKPKYAFVLGHCPELSRAEIIRTLEHENIDFRPVFSNQQLFIIETNDQLEASKLQERLGGTVKILRITHHPPATLRLPEMPSWQAGVAMRAGESRSALREAKGSKLEEVIKEIIIKRLPFGFAQGEKDLKIKDKKFQFGFSYYGKGQLLDLQRIGLKIKKELKEQGVQSRFIVSKEPGLSSVIVQKERLIDRGVDVVIIQAANQYYVGYTVSVQKFEEYSRRDYGRPSRDDKSGMLPPKLAKIMLNLSQTDFNQTILDPFCGSGTVIQEALFMGYKNIIGSDISEKAVKDSQNNINWFKIKYGLDISGVKIYQLDATQLSKKIAMELVDCIVTEPYLGPAEKSLKFQVSNIISGLSELYLKTFAEFYKVLKRGGKIVIIFPMIDSQRLAILDKIEDSLLRFSSYGGQEGLRVDKLSDTPRGSLIYSRPKQKVLREIFVFKKE